MNEGWKYLRLKNDHLSDLGKGLFGTNLVDLDGFEQTFIKGDKGFGHGFHRHEALHEILIFLEGEGKLDMKRKMAKKLVSVAEYREDGP